MLLLVLFWAVPFTRAVGGRGVHSELLLAAVLLVVCLAQRLWRAPPQAVWLTAVVSSAAIAVCLLSPTGWYGADVAAGYVFGGAIFLIARCYLKSTERCYAIGAAVCLAGLYEFSQSLITWIGSHDPATEMAGTFYWHNPYAAFLLPGAVIGLGLAAGHRSPWHLVGWVTTPCCVAGIVFSTSRATLAVLVISWIFVFAAILRVRAGLGRASALVALCVAVTFALPGPPFFPHYVSPLSTINERSATGQTLGQNGAYRVEFWKEAAEVALHHPVSGGGYHSLATTSVLYTPGSWARSQLAHDGYLQSLSDGGLVLGVPFLFALLIVVLWALRRAWALVAHGPGGSVDTVNGTIAIALLAAAVHSAVDFDWSHPAILVEFALLAACVAPPVESAVQSRHGRVFAVGGSILLLAIVAMLIPILHRWQIDQPSTLTSPTTLLDDARSTFGDYRPAEEVLYDRSLGMQPVSDRQAADALRLTRRAATIDLHLALLREAIAADIGRDPDAVTHSQALLDEVQGDKSHYTLDLATVMVAAGDNVGARNLLTADLGSQGRAGIATPDSQSELALWADHLGRGSGYACQLKAATHLLDTAAVASLPRPRSICLAIVHQGHPS